MSIVTNVITAVLKAVVGDKFGSGLAKELIGISIDGISEKGINDITDFIASEKSKIKHIFSEENMISMGIQKDNIDYVVAEIKDLFSKISITDEVFRQCKYDIIKLTDLMWEEYLVCKNRIAQIECENDIKKCLVAVSTSLLELACKSEGFSERMLVQISNSSDDTNVGLQKISEYMEDNFGKLDDTNQAILELLRAMIEQNQKISNLKNNGSSDDQVVMFKNDKKQYYIKIWNSRLFLHINNEKNPLTLKKAFIMPDYKVRKKNQRIGFSYYDSLGEIIEKFINYNRSSTMLITGVPGIGKSSIVSWIADRYKDNKQVLILRFRDWSKEKLGTGLIDAICDTLNCSHEDLDNKIVILDGFDELKALDARNELLSMFFDDYLDRNNFKCIITSRTNYIMEDQFDNVLEVLVFNRTKIGLFHETVKGKKLDEVALNNNLDVLGVPVILYMALVSNIDITRTATKPELYNRIFSIKGGIFDRFSYEGVAYSEGTHVLRNPDNIKKYLAFLREVAFKMFEKNSLSLETGEYEAPEILCQGKNVNILDFPIRYLLEKTQSDIEFIHLTIYEYFVAEYIYLAIEKELNNKEGAETAMAAVLGLTLKSRYLPNEILEFMKYKIRNSRCDLKFEVISEAFRLMLQDGMTYYTGQCYRNVIKCEMYIFANMLELLHILKRDFFTKPLLNLADCIKYDRTCNLNLQNANLQNANLSNVDLRNANLQNANLSGANLSGANLSGANLSNAILDGTILLGANLTGSILVRSYLVRAKLDWVILKQTDLRGADIVMASLDKTNLSDAKLTNADLRGADLRKVDLRKSDLREVNLSRANLNKVDFQGAKIDDTILDDANITDAIFDINQIMILEKRYNLKQMRIYVCTVEGIISYEKFCEKRGWV